jgi:hypothetical protein
MWVWKLHRQHGQDVARRRAGPVRGSAARQLVRGGIQDLDPVEHLAMVLAHSLEDSRRVHLASSSRGVVFTRESSEKTPLGP